jgi:hypothetical protein
MSGAELWARGWLAFLERDEFEVARQHRPDDRQRVKPVGIEACDGTRGNDGHSQSHPHEAHYRRELSNGHRVLKGYPLLGCRGIYRSAGPGIIGQRDKGLAGDLLPAAGPVAWLCDLMAKPLQ